MGKIEEILHSNLKLKEGHRTTASTRLRFASPKLATVGRQLRVLANCSTQSASGRKTFKRSK